MAGVVAETLVFVGTLVKEVHALYEAHSHLKKALKVTKEKLEAFHGSLKVWEALYINDKDQKFPAELLDPLNECRRFLNAIEEIVKNLDRKTGKFGKMELFFKGKTLKEALKNNENGLKQAYDAFRMAFDYYMKNSACTDIQKYSSTGCLFWLNKFKQKEVSIPDFFAALQVEYLNDRKPDCFLNVPDADFKTFLTEVCCNDKEKKVITILAFQAYLTMDGKGTEEDRNLYDYLNSTLRAWIAKREKSKEEKKVEENIRAQLIEMTEALTNVKETHNKEKKSSQDVLAKMTEALELERKNFEEAKKQAQRLEEEKKKL